MGWEKKQVGKGFTIVELLIVVVVIAILAAITIVAYNGIQNRAKSSALQSSASQAARKLALSAVEAGDLFPANKADFMAQANLADTSSATYDYVVSTDRRGYCVSATDSSGASQAVVSNNATATQGRCVENLVLNPSFELNTANTGRVSGQGGVTTVTTSVPSPVSGSAAHRSTWTTAPTNVTTGGLWTVANSVTGLNAGGKVYTASGYVRNSWAGGSFSLNLVGRTSGGTVTSETYGPATTIPSNNWVRVSVTWTAPSNTDYFEVRIRQGGGTLPSVGSTMDVDAFMLTESPRLYSYGGAEAANWQSREPGVNACRLDPLHWNKL